MLLCDNIDLVLDNDHMLQLHDFDSSKVLTSLGLGARLVAGDK
jgi:hypothetical protein